MTCVVGIKTVNGVLLAGDSLGSTDKEKRERKDAKTFLLDDTLAIAYCGSYRLGQILTYHMDGLIIPPLGMDEHKWAVREFIPFLRDVTYEHGFLTKDTNNVEELSDSAFLLAVRGRLFDVEPDLQVGEDELPFSALGSGGREAAGTLLGLLKRRKKISDAEGLEFARVAIQSATSLTPFVGGKITSVKTITYTEVEKKLARKILGR